jgi:cysteinyl-tRNA synthetase
MKVLIERLVASGHAYVAEDHVLFSVSSMPDYGKLSKRSLDEMIAGARVDVAPYKREAMDFVLWKPSKPGEPAWPSPSGIAAPGRPGWHIECSAMSWKHLGETFDIHGGGIDLVFPHHENEIAQSRCAFHSSVMANYWMHNGFLQVEGEKMSKSLGNFVTIRDAVSDWSGLVARFAMLGTHYRQPIDWSRRKLWDASVALDKFKRWYADDRSLKFDADYDREARLTGFDDALLDDLNTPEAIAILHGGIGEISQAANAGTATDRLISELSNSLRLLGLEGVENFDINKQSAQRVYGGQLDEARINNLITERNAARKARDFKEADRIRDELKAMGVELEDKKDGTTLWKVKQ